MRAARTTIVLLAAAFALGAERPPSLSPEEINDRTSTPLLTDGATGAAVVRLQVLLDRAHYAPGEIDGRFRGNTARALAAFQRDREISEAGTGPLTWAALDVADPRPAVVRYSLTEADVAGPYSAIPRDMMAKARLRALGWRSALERISEKFHASPSFLEATNLDASWRAGETLVVPFVDRPPLAPAARIVVDDSDLSVSSWDSEGRFLARYPATLGGPNDPLCYGDWKVLEIRRNPRFRYDPSLFWDAPSWHRRATLAAGPNSPVGLVWIQLSIPNCGIHGTSDSSRIGRRESHGCIRLTNWDAVELSLGLEKGIPVVLQR